MLATVIIPTYNYAQYIHEAIDSVLNSDFPKHELEIIVIDDGSTDNTKLCLEKYQLSIRYIYQNNSGKAAATQKGVGLAQGKYIFNLDADDVFLPKKIKKVVEKFERDPDLTHVSHPALYWTVTTNIKEPETIPDELKNRKIKGQELINYFYPRRMLFGGGSTFAVKAEFLKKYEIPASIDMYTDEYLVLVALHGGYTYFLDEPLSIWRIHGNNFSGSAVNPERVQQKNQRNLASMEAVLAALKSQNFSSPLPEIYELKVQSSKIALQQDLGEFSVRDVLLLWQIFFQNLPKYQGEALTILKNYTLLNRTLPPEVFRVLKQIKNKLTHAARN